jgi:hypothetical protein
MATQLTTTDPPAAAITADPEAALTENVPAESIRARLLLMLPFLILFYVQLVHHQLWRDEINAWGVVVTSTSLRDLLRNVHYEAHPALWYLLLYPMSKFTHAPWMLKLVEACIGTGIYLALALTSPLRKAEQLLVYCSFYVLFEYTVMSRMYGLMFLFALIYLHGRLKYPYRLVRNTLWLGLIANTDVTGMILSGGLLLEYWIDQRAYGERFDKYLRAGAVYLGMVALSAATLWPAKDISWRTTGRAFEHLHDKSHLLHAVLSYLSLPWFPIHRYFPRNFWDAQAQAHPSVYLALLPVTVGVMVWVFRKRPRMLLMLGAIAIVGTAFTHLVYLGSLRHFGIMFIAFLFGIWILRYRHEFVSKIAYVLLALSALSGAAAACGQWLHPFADDAAAAAWMRQHGLENASLIGTPDTHVVGLAEMLQRPMYFLDCSCVDTYMKFSARRDNFDPKVEVPARLERAVHDLHAPVMVLAMNRPFTDAEQQQLSQALIETVPLAQFTEGDIVDEHFFLYKVGADGSPAH